MQVIATFKIKLGLSEAEAVFYWSSYPSAKHSFECSPCIRHRMCFCCIAQSLACYRLLLIVCMLLLVVVKPNSFG
jgi:hypothetical protein